MLVHYVLLFPNGDNGWHFGLQLQANANTAGNSLDYPHRCIITVFFTSDLLSVITTSSITAAVFFIVDT